MRTAKTDQTVRFCHEVAQMDMAKEGDKRVPVDTREHCSFMPEF